MPVAYMGKVRMEMLIRSQDKKFIVKFDNIAIQATPKGVICYDISELESDSYISLGNYSTEEKTFKVLDMIQEAYETYEYEKAFKTGLTLFETFQMPDDGSVEV